MPPRPTTSFNTDNANEVVCPLKQQDGTTCRKRCFGEKRFRSMQEHIRRAHPNHYISKLPATEESFNLMVNTPPHEITPDQSLQDQLSRQVSGSYDPNMMHSVGNLYHHTSPIHDRSNTTDVRRPSFVPTANAAAALAQLHNSRPDSEWDPDREQESFMKPDHDQNFPNYFAGADQSNIFSESQASLPDSDRSNNLLPAQFPPSARNPNMQPWPRMKPARPRKSSITESARKPKHERDKSKEHKRLSSERKAMSAEPNAAGLASKRWEDLLDAAASATEEDSRDLTPIPQSPRGSVPPYQGQNQQQHQYQSYNTSPLQNAILPHSPENQNSFENPPLEPFPSVESSYDTSPQQQTPYQHHTHTSSADSALSNSGLYNWSRSAHTQQSSSSSTFQVPQGGIVTSPNDISSGGNGALGRSQLHGHSYSQPQFPTYTHHGGVGIGAQQAPPAAVVQHYCAACHKIVPLNSSYACQECICGICRDCVDVLVTMGPDRGAACPRCQTMAGRFKPFMLDLR